MLDLMAAPYTTDFIPPDTETTAQYAQGTSANRFGGGDLAGERSNNRSVPLLSHIRGTSDAMVGGAIARLRQFIGRGSDPDNPVYLEYCLNTDIALRPLWGQGLWRRYELVNNDGPAVLWKRFSDVSLRAQGAEVNVSLMVRPFAVGVPQLVATATGGILSDQWGTTDGAERGLQILNTRINYMTNPAFGLAVAGSGITVNGWSIQSNIIASQNTNPNFLLPQTQNSVLAQSLGATNNALYQTITLPNVHTYSLSALVARPDGAAVTSADMQLTYSSVLTTTFRALGDGLYLATATATGQVAGIATGITIKSGRSVYLLAFQIEDSTFPTTICWGDLLGCSWAGPAHASTSTRASGTLKLPIDDTLARVDQGSLTFTWIAPIAHSAYSAADFYFVDMHDGGGGSAGLQFYYHQPGPTVIFGNTNGTGSSAITWAAGDVIVWTITWGPTGGLIIYKNGAAIATQGTYTPGALAATMWIGSNFSGANQPNGVFADLRTFPHEMTAAEVAADCANASAVSGATQDVAQRVGAIPWRWTNGGDDVVGPGTGLVNTVQKYNWLVFGGIPGSAPAITQAKLTASGSFNTATDIWLSRALFPFFYNPANVFFANQGGTGDVGNSIGDDYSTKGVTGPGITSWIFTLDNPSTLLIQGREVYLFTRLTDAGANLTLSAFNLITGSNISNNTDFVPIAATATMLLFKSPPLVVPRIRKKFNPEDVVLGTFNFRATLTRTIAGLANVSMDFFALMPRPLTRILVTAVAGGPVLLLNGRNAQVINGPSYTDPAIVSGDIFELEPGGYNIVQSLFGSVGSAYSVTTTLTFTNTYVTPRYALL